MADKPVSSEAREALAALLFAETSDTHYAMTMTDARDIAGRMLRGTRGKPLAVPYPQPGSELDPSRRWVEGRLSATPAGPEERGEGLTPEERAVANRRIAEFVDTGNAGPVLTNDEFYGRVSDSGAGRDVEARIAEIVGMPYDDDSAVELTVRELRAVLADTGAEERLRAAHQRLIEAEAAFSAWRAVPHNYTFGDRAAATAIDDERQRHVLAVGDARHALDRAFHDSASSGTREGTDDGA